MVGSIGCVCDVNDEANRLPLQKVMCCSLPPLSTSITPASKPREIHRSSLMASVATNPEVFRAPFSEALIKELLSRVDVRPRESHKVSRNTLGTQECLDQAAPSTHALCLPTEHKFNKDLERKTALRLNQPQEKPSTSQSGLDN